jgi:crotonobetainyl-CoA:carnitine CoA-transferase CaiB-like acyl-CoA transferase
MANNPHSPAASSTARSLLAHLTVVDLTTELGALAGRLLAELGAQVIRVEPSKGDPLRRREPVVPGKSGTDVSLYWLNMMKGRKTEFLDLETSVGAEKFRTLLGTADVVIESQPAGRMGSLGLDYPDFRHDRTALIWTSITPFGRLGPRSGWEATDITGMAAGGLMSLCGDSDRPPLRVAVEQGYAQAGVVAVTGTLAALHARSATGFGQLVDVSMQEAVSNCLGNARLYYEFDKVVTRRAGGSRAYGERGTRLVYPCRDGFLAMSRNAETPRLLFEWMQEEGMKPQFDPVEWATLPQAGAGMASAEKTLELESDIEAFFAPKTKLVAYEEGQRRGIMVCPVSTPADLLLNEQLVQRRYFVKTFYPELGDSFMVPGPPVRMSAPAPALPFLSPKTSKSNNTGHPFSGSHDSHSSLSKIRVADFSWVGVGPLATQTLGFLGAEVVHVESSTRLDGLRSAGPRRGEGPDAGAYFANFNRDKLGMTLNLHAPGAREVALRLARESDVLVESFRPGFMASVGLSYDEVAAINPSIIMMSCSMEGASGPHAGFRGFGLTLQATVGFTHFTGWPDRPPVGTGTAYTDWFAANVAASLLLAAIEHRRLTGQGQFIDLSQLEACIWALDAEVLRYSVTGDFGWPSGNRHPELTPHGVFPCLGSDQWVAVSIRDEGDWDRLTAVLEDPRLCKPEYSSVAGRRTAEEEIEAIVSSWTARHDKLVAATVLQARGVPAYPVNDVADVQNDVQLRYRGHFWRQRHPVIGEADWDAPAFRLSRTPLYPSKPAPLLGGDNEYVYGHILGFSPDELAELTVAGVLE